MKWICSKQYHPIASIYVSLHQHHQRLGNQASDSKVQLDSLIYFGQHQVTNIASLYNSWFSKNLDILIKSFLDSIFGKISSNASSTAPLVT